MEPMDNDQYLVKVDGSGRLTVRNRRFLRKYSAASPTITYPKQPRSVRDDVTRAVADGDVRDHHVLPTENDDTQSGVIPAPVPDTPTVHDDDPPEQLLPAEPDTAQANDDRPMLVNHRPRRERRQRKVYDAHTGTWVNP